MNRRERAQMIELLRCAVRCAADLDIRNAEARYGVVRLAVDQLNLPNEIWWVATDLATPIWQAMPGTAESKEWPWYHALLEAAQRVEEGSLP